MRPDRQLVRLMAAMIVMIIAYVVPSAVQAHEGHHHGSHDHAVMTKAAVVYVEPVAPASRDIVMAAAVATEIAVGIEVAVMPRVATLQTTDAGRGCCPGPCQGACCGTMTCHASGILSGPASLPTLAFGHVVLVTHDVDGRPGLGPEALPRPPRTLA